MKKTTSKDWWKVNGTGAKDLKKASTSGLRKLDDFEVLKADKAYEALEDIPNFISIAELASKLGISKSLIRQDIRAGLLPAEAIGRQYRIDPRNVKAYLSAKRDQIRRKSA
jgi:excisionase family DNA binding protein